MTRKALLIECKEVTRDRLTLSARGLHQASGKMQFSVTAVSIMHVPRRESDDANRRFRGRSEQATGFRRNGWSTYAGISARHGSEYAASDQDRPPTQQIEWNAPSPDSSCERFHAELLWCFREHRPRWVLMRLALPIEGEAMIALGAISVRHARWMLSVLDYGNVMAVSRLGKNSEGIQIRAILR
jgi:hypothetical protein